MSDVELKSGERLDDLQFNSLYLIQNVGKYRFSEDAVLLSRFVEVKDTERCIDMGTGTGVIATLVNAHMGASVLGIDIQEELVDMALRSKALNAQQGVEFAVADIRECYKHYSGFDAAICNPPYFKGMSASVSSSERVSKHADDLSLFDICLAMKRVLKYGGRAYFVYPAKYMAELFFALKQNALEPKKLTLVSNELGEPARLCLVMAKLGGGSGMSVDVKIAREMLI